MDGFVILNDLVKEGFIEKEKNCEVEPLGWTKYLRTGDIALRRNVFESLLLSAAPALLILLSVGACQSSPDPKKKVASVKRAEPKKKIEPKKRTEPIKPIMTKEFSPSMSRIAFFLFHREEDTSKEEAFKDIYERSETILKAAKRLCDLPALKTQDTPEFQLLAKGLYREVRALKDAAYNQNQDQTVHWYWHVQESCNHCHSQFRGY